MSGFVCPLCGSQTKSGSCERLSSFTQSFVTYYCGHYGAKFALEQDIDWGKYGKEETERLLDLTVEHLVHEKHCNINGKTRPWHFYYCADSTGIEGNGPEYVNLAVKMKDYPTQTIDAAHRTLLNMAVRYPHYGHQFRIDASDHRLGFARMAKNEQRVGIISLLIDLQYIHAEIGRDCHLCTITALGWQKIDELRKQEKTIRQGFVAMAFRDEAKPIRESFRKAISAMGYQAVILDEKEHNNQIVPEIFYEIKRSKFVVVDVTYPNYGAYYEAGFAQALGKPVIICCQKQVYDDPAKRPHFDIAQQPIIVWENHADLVSRLKSRIEATVV